MRRELGKRIAYCTLYSVAMAYVESAVVLYLRLLFTGGAGHLAILPPPSHVYDAEIAREFATMVMLASVALMQSRKPRVVLAYFLYCFGVWDIFYYVWLEVLTAWPQSLLSWDILFIIPVPWFAPVLSPLVVSLMFVAGSLAALRLEHDGRPMVFTPGDAAAALAGSAILIASYVSSRPGAAYPTQPRPYSWWLFAVGAAIWAVMFVRRYLLSGSYAQKRVSGSP